MLNELFQLYGLLFLVSAVIFIVGCLVVNSFLKKLRSGTSILRFLVTLLLAGHAVSSSYTPQPKEHTTITREKEIIKEIVKIKCRYCGKLYDQHENKCSYCGGS